MHINRKYKDSQEYLSEEELQELEDKELKELKKSWKRRRIDNEYLKDDKVISYKKALQLANKLGKPVVYGYTSKRNPNKFYAIEMREYNGDAVSFRSRYSANVIYVAYPDIKY